jgi:hypothetical protein
MSNLICHPQAQPNLLRFFSKDDNPADDVPADPKRMAYLVLAMLA